MFFLIQGDDRDHEDGYPGTSGRYQGQHMADIMDETDVTKHKTAMPDISPGPGKRKGKADPEIPYMRELTSTITNLSNAMMPPKNQVIGDAEKTRQANTLWCQLLASKLDKLPPLESEAFKYEVDGKMLRLLRQSADSDE